MNEIDTTDDTCRSLCVGIRDWFAYETRGLLVPEEAHEVLDLLLNRIVGDDKLLQTLISGTQIAYGYEWSVRPPDFNPNIWPTYITNLETEAQWKLHNHPDWDLVRRRRWISLGEWEIVPREAPAGLGCDQPTTGT